MLIIDQKRPGIYNITISGYELAALISSARWVVDGAKGELNTEAIEQLRQVLDNYDKAIQRKEKESAYLKFDSLKNE